VLVSGGKLGNDVTRTILCNRPADGSGYVCTVYVFSPSNDQNPKKCVLQPSAADSFTNFDLDSRAAWLIEPVARGGDEGQGPSLNFRFVHCLAVR
jgi:hypothetical protein